jgi:hypothetical protein
VGIQDEVVILRQELAVAQRLGAVDDDVLFTRLKIDHDQAEAGFAS